MYLYLVKGKRWQWGGYADNDEVGATWIFTRTGMIWTQQGSKLIGTGGVGKKVAQGYSVSLSGLGNVLAVGGPTIGLSERGQTWIFGRRRLPCVYSGTKVMTKRGIKEIKYIVKGEEVLNRAGNWVKVEGNMKFGRSGKMYKVGSLYVRGDHPLWRGKKVLASSVGDVVRVKKDNVYSLRTERQEYVWMDGEYVSTWSIEGANKLTCKYEEK